MLVMVALYFKEFSRTNFKYGFLQGPHWLEVHGLLEQAGARKVLWVLQEVH